MWPGVLQTPGRPRPLPASHPLWLASAPEVDEGRGAGGRATEEEGAVGGALSGACAECHQDPQPLWGISPLAVASASPGDQHTFPGKRALWEGLGMLVVIAKTLSTRLRPCLVGPVPCG